MRFYSLLLASALQAGLSLLNETVSAEVIFRAFEHCDEDWGQLNNCKDIPRDRVEVSIPIPRVADTKNEFIRSQVYITSIQYSFPCKSVLEFEKKYLRYDECKHNLVQNGKNELIKLTSNYGQLNSIDLHLSMDPFSVVSSKCHLDIEEIVTYLDYYGLVWYSSQLNSINNTLNFLFEKITPDADYVNAIQTLRQSKSFLLSLKLSVSPPMRAFLDSFVSNIENAEAKVTTNCGAGSEIELCTKSLQEARESVHALHTEINEESRSFQRFIAKELQRISGTPSLNEYKEALQALVVK